MLGLLLGFKGGTFFPPISPESDFFMAVGEIEMMTEKKKEDVFQWEKMQLKTHCLPFFFSECLVCE